MMLKTLLAAGAIALVLGPTALAVADDNDSPDTKSFLAAYADGSEAGQVLGESYVIGIANGLAVANLVLKNRDQELIYCQPKNDDLDAKLLILSISKSVDATPKLGTLPLPVMVGATLEMKWPCKAEQGL